MDAGVILLRCTQPSVTKSKRWDVAFCRILGFRDLLRISVRISVWDLGFEMSSQTATLQATSSAQALEHLSVGEPIQNARITDLLDLDPLVVSRWLCGEDMRGIYQPIVMRRCVLDGLDLEGRTFYEIVELVGCHVAAAYFKHAYFYSRLLVEDCIFTGAFDGRGIQSDGRIVAHNAMFTDWADFSGIDVRGRADLINVSFPGGTNLLHIMAERAHDLPRRAINLSGCQFRPADIPRGLDTARLGIMPLVEQDPSGMERQWRELIEREKGDPVSVVGGSLFPPHQPGAVNKKEVRTTLVLAPRCHVK